VGRQIREAHALLAAGLEDAAAAAGSGGAAEEAIRYLSRATEILPQRAVAWARLVEVQIDFGRLRDARTTLGAAWAALEPDTYEARLGELERRVSLGGDPSTAESEDDVFGREADVAAVSEAWRACQEGQATVIVFQSGPGGGKTRMLREAEAPLVAPGARVIRISCRSEERGAAERWGVAREIIGRLSALPGAQDAELGSEDRLESLGQLPLEELAHPFLPFLDLFASVGRTTPVLLSLDDIDWIDPESWNLLRRLIRLRPASSILIVASLTEQQNPDRGPAEDIATWWSKGWVQVRRLRPLSAAEVEAAVRLRGWRDEQFVRSLREVLHLRSKGTPAIVFGLLDSMAEAGFRPSPPGASQGATQELPRLDQLPFSDGLLRFHRGRLARLDPAAQEVLSVLEPTDTAQLETLSYAVSSNPETIRRVLEELEEAGFILSDGEGFRLAHPDYSKLGQSRRPRPRAPDPVSETRAPAPGPTPAPISSTADAAASGPDTEKRPADRSGPTPEPRLTDTPRRLGAAWSSPADSSLSATGKDPFADSVRSPILEKYEREYYVPKPSLIPAGWRPQPPAFIAAGVLGGIIWIIWTLFFK